MSLRIIGGVAVENPIWLAPLAGVTTPSLRLFHRELGAGLVHTEMVSALGLIYGGAKTRSYLDFSEEERPIVLQLFGPSPETLYEGAQIATSSHRYEAIQINMACPMPKVTKKGSGSKMLDDPDGAARVVRELKRLGLPVWVKIRLLPYTHPMTTESFCEKMLEAGVDLIFIHGRTPAQRYEGVANRERVCQIAKSFPGVIVGSGDYYKPQDAIEMLDHGCIAVIAARGILRDVLLIPKTLYALGYSVDTSLLESDMQRQIQLVVKMADRAVLCEGEHLALILVRRMLGGMLKGFQGAAALRQSCSTIKNWPEMREMLLLSAN